VHHKTIDYIGFNAEDLFCQRFIMLRFAARFLALDLTFPPSLPNATAAGFLTFIA